MKQTTYEIDVLETVEIIIGASNETEALRILGEESGKTGKEYDWNHRELVSQDGDEYVYALDVVDYDVFVVQADTDEESEQLLEELVNGSSKTYDWDTVVIADVKYA